METQKEIAYKRAKWTTVAVTCLVGFLILGIVYCPDKELLKCRAKYQETNCTIENRILKTGSIVPCKAGTPANKACYAKYPITVIYPTYERYRPTKLHLISGCETSLGLVLLDICEARDCRIQLGPREYISSEPRVLFGGKRTEVCFWDGEEMPFLLHNYPCRHFLHSWLMTCMTIGGLAILYMALGI